MFAATGFQADGHHQIFVWDIESNQLFGRSREQKARINVVSFSPTLNLLGSGGKDDAVKVWDLSDASNERVLTMRHLFHFEREVLDLKFSKSGEKLAVRIMLALVIVDLNRNVPLWQVQVTGQVSVGTVIFCGMNEDCVMTNDTEYGDDILELFSAETGMQLPISSHPGNSQVFLMTHSPQSDYFATGSMDDDIMLWESSSVTFLASVKCTRDLSEIVLTQTEEGQSQLYAAFADYSVKVWEVPSLFAVRLFRVGVIFHQKFDHMALSPDGNKMLVGRQFSQAEHPLVLCDAASGDVLTVPLSEPKLNLVYDVCFSPSCIILM